MPSSRRLRPTVAVFACALLAACGGGGSEPASTPAPPAAPATPGGGAPPPQTTGTQGLSAPTTLSFPQQALGASTVLQLMVTSTGTAPLVISGITTTTSFSAAGNCVGSHVPNASCSIAVTYTAAWTGTATGTLHIAYDGGRSHVVDLAGSAISASGWVQGQFAPAANFAARCAAPRSGINPLTGAPWPDVQGTPLDERQWLRSWSHELYLWFDELQDRDPGAYGTAQEYFDVLKVAGRDRFHFSMPTSEWIARSTAGVSAGYGANFVVLRGTPPREVVVAYTEPGSPAHAAGLVRGTRVKLVDGVDLVNSNDDAGIATLNAGLFPAAAGATHVLAVQDPGAATTRNVTLTSASVTIAPVQFTRVLPTATGPVGYLLFNDHIATAERALAEAFETLRAANVTDLVLDLRYNGGGYLAIASEAAYMIAGPTRTVGRTFERLQFNRKHPVVNPVTGQTIAPLPFNATARDFSLPAGQALPALGLSRVFVLAGPDTCSASESIINALRGVDVEVVLVGATTCGKPYGYYPADNCGTTWFSIQFRGVNAKGFGDYTNGFAPPGAVGSGAVTLPGCFVADDFAHALGDPAEHRLAAALAYRTTGSCPVQPVGVVQPQATAELRENAGPALGEGRGLRAPWRQNRLLRD